MTPRRSPSRFRDGLWLMLFLVLLAGVALLVDRARTAVLEGYSPTEDLAAWEAWREESERQAAGSGPVRRQPSSSPLPPAYVLLRDHYGACLIGILLTSSVFLGVILWLLRGVIQGSTSVIPAGDSMATAPKTSTKPAPPR